MNVTMTASSLRKMALHSTKNVSKLVELWSIKSSLTGGGDYFCAIEDCNVTVSSENDVLRWSWTH
jgi:hypothetical protein